MTLVSRNNNFNQSPVFCIYTFIVFVHSQSASWAYFWNQRVCPTFLFIDRLHQHPYIADYITDEYTFFYICYICPTSSVILLVLGCFMTMSRKSLIVIQTLLFLGKIKLAELLFLNTIILLWITTDYGVLFNKQKYN